MSVRRAMSLTAVLAFVIAPVVWASRGAVRAREAARSAQCVSNLKQIGLGLLNYEARHGCFPPAFVADTQGKPL
jgi:Protein of unknown function (DUF1559)